ncbi:MAG: acyltransferase [Sphingomonadales bacterium]|nr:MAG: acyltransferase [Sphingomonadales bacterium]
MQAGAAARKRHIPTLDGLRGIAALLVVFSHFPTLGLGAVLNARVGDYGVLLFFVLSGFLMGYLYLDERFDRQSVVSYTAARVARIVPLYYVVVIVSFVLSKAIGPAFVNHMSDTEFVRLLLFAGKITVFWSIGPEVQFYAVFVLIWLGMASGALGRLSWLVGAVLAAALVILAQTRFPGVTVMSKLHIFLAGVIVSQLFVRVRDEGSELAFTIAQVVALGLVVLIALPDPPFAELFYPPVAAIDVKHDAVFGNLKIVLMIAAILLAFTHETRFSRVVLANRVARLAGLYSFSLYLLHEPVMQGVTALLADRDVPKLVIGVADVLAAFLVSAASFRLLERPAQRKVRQLVTHWTDRGVVAPPP